MDGLQHSMTRSGRVAALALALAPLGPAALAQGVIPDSAVRVHAQVCVNGACSEDSNRVVVVRLMNQVDSLQRIYLGKPIAPTEQEQVKAQLESMLRRINELQSDRFSIAVEQADAESRAATPKGWIGINFVGASIAGVRDGQYLVRFLDYPEVESVEPASPAQRAGISRGDMLLSFNGKDVTTQPISMTRLLQPDAKVLVRMKRDGKPRDFTLTVAQAPRTYALRMEDFAAPRATVVVGTPAVPPDAPPAPRAVISGRMFPSRERPVEVRAGTFLSFDSENAPVAGAQMNTLNADLARNLNLGVTQGVMVMSVSDGSPAREAGLQSGDVVVTVAGDSVTSVRELRHELQRHAGEPTVELQVVRNRKPQKITLSNQ